MIIKKCNEEIQVSKDKYCQFPKQWADNFHSHDLAVQYVSTPTALLEANNALHNQLTTTVEMIEDGRCQLYKIFNTENDTILGVVEVLSAGGEYFGCDPLWRFGNVDVEEWECVKQWAIYNNLPVDIISARLELAEHYLACGFDDIG